MSKFGEIKTLEDAERVAEHKFHLDDGYDADETIILHATLITQISIARSLERLVELLVDKLE